LACCLCAPLGLSAGAAIDFSMATVTRTHLQRIADGAALAGGREFDGTNLDEATKIAEDYIASYQSEIPADTTFNITADGRVLQIAITGSSETSLMRLAGYDKIDVGVVAAAKSPLKVEKVKFTPTKAPGWYYKKVSVTVVRPGSTDEVVLGTVTYQPETHANSGQGTMVAEPKGDIELGQYTKLILKMDIKNDGCGIGYKAKINGNEVTCSKSNADSNQHYDSVLRTDNPETSHYLFVDGVQLPQGITQPLEAYFGCAEEQSHAWEDGGEIGRAHV